MNRPPRTPQITQSRQKTSNNTVPGSAVHQRGSCYHAHNHTETLTHTHTHRDWIFVVGFLLRTRSINHTPPCLHFCQAIFETLGETRRAAEAPLGVSCSGTRPAEGRTVRNGKNSERTVCDASLIPGDEANAACRRCSKTCCALKEHAQQSARKRSTGRKCLDQINIP